MAMSKNEMVEKVAVTAGVTKAEAKKVVNAVVDVLTEEMANGGSVQIVGFGTFTTRHKNATEGFNPATKEKIHIEAREVPVFKPGKSLKDACNA